MDYKACTPAKFQKSVWDRNLIASADPPRDSSAMVKLLRSADQHASFCFQDLIPKRRDVVYRELLAVRIQDETGFPEILGVSKPVRERGLCHTGQR